MRFDSLEYLIFLAVVFVLYWFVTARSLRLQNLFVIAASYFFYSWWDARFLSLIVASSLVDFFVGLKLDGTENPRGRKALLTLSVVTNLGILGFFKYFNFFLDSLLIGLNSLGLDLDRRALNIILPVGISFYTFQTLSYTIDVYRRRMKPTRDILAFFAFVSFFPQLVAGPIERAENLLHQFLKKREFDLERAKDGCRQMLWGLFQKIVLANSCAIYVDSIFEDYPNENGATLLLGSIYFAFQIYCDFGGYSNIAIGVAKLFGFTLRRNFATPYFSRSPIEFWKRWHVSLSTWFRDYLYIPLGGSRVPWGKHVRNILIVFVISGLWHGANGTFLLWGFFHGIFYLAYAQLSRAKPETEIVACGKWLPSALEFFQVAVTFLVVAFLWILFRAPTLTDALAYAGGIFSQQLLARPRCLSGLLYVLPFVAVEWIRREQDHVLKVENLPIVLRWCIYLLVFNLLFLMGTFDFNEFIYFQF